MRTQPQRIVELDSVDEKLELLAHKGIYILGGAIDIASMAGLTANIITRLSSLDKIPMWILLNSPGGDIIQGLAVYDLIKAIAGQGWEINIIGLGQVASMAVCIMQAGTKRYALSNTQFTIHQASLFSEAEDRVEVNKMVEDTKELKRLNHIILKIIAERSGMDMRQLLRRSKKTDYTLDTTAAKEFGERGLIDEIITTFPFQL